MFWRKQKIHKRSDFPYQELESRKLEETGNQISQPYQVKETLQLAGFLAMLFCFCIGVYHYWQISLGIEIQLLFGFVIWLYEFIRESHWIVIIIALFLLPLILGIYMTIVFGGTFLLFWALVLGGLLALFGYTF